MILRKLEVYGFKSFADRQVLTFSNGITAVIGPNGCGKSNVVDAFKWILGEQAPSSLRSKGMSDVIHLDREGKEAVPYAEGSITFDNSNQVLHWDAPEVVITRRIHRDGRSEYLVNNQQVRLRTVRDMFLGTGIGTRSYFVLEQGRITDIIKRSPLERRAIFEEAAGIGRYNQRRREAERKLVGVEESLNRAHDVIAEISRQIRSLRIQAGRARSYNETAAKLREIRIRAGIIRYRVINIELAAIAERLADEATEETRARAAEHDAAAARELSQALRQAALEAVHRYRTAVQENRSRVEGWRERIAGARTEVERLEGQSAEKREESARMDQALEARRAELADIDRRHREASRARRVFTELRLVKAEELDDAKESAAGVQAELERLRQEAYDRDRDRAQLVTRVGAVRVRSGNLEGSLDRLRRRGHELSAQLARIGSDRMAAESRTEELATTLADAQNALEAATSAQQEARVRLKELDRRTAEERVNLKERQGRLGVLKDLEASHAGVGEGARHLLGTDDSGRGSAAAGILGLLGEGLDLDPRFARAIERALGEDVEALLARDAGAALDAADALKRRGKGGASFWATGSAPGGKGRARPDWLDTVQPSRKGVLGWAPDFVKADAPVRDAAKALLADVVVVEDRETATALRDAGHTDDWRLVTLDGEIFGPSARIRAGESVQSGGLISRRVEIRRVAAEIEVLDRSLVQLESERGAAEDEVVRTEREVAEASEQLRTRDLDRAEKIQELDELRRRERDLEEERRIGEDEAQEIGADQDGLRSEENELAAAIEAQEERLDEIRRRESWLETRQGGASRYLDQMKSEAERVESVGMTLRRREGELQYLKHQVLERISDMDHGLTRLADESKGLADWVQRHESERTRLEIRIEEAQRDRVRWESLLAQADQELRSSEDSVHSATREEEEARRALDAVRSARENDRVREGELKTRIEALVERLREEEGLDLAQTAEAAEASADAGDASVNPPGTGDAPADTHVGEGLTETEVEEEPDLDALEQEAAQLKRKLDRLGPVNAAAIDELEELEKRERFYLAQEEDLVSSKQALEDIIRRINKRSRQIFLETFNTVRSEFRSIFRRMFGGGRGDIRLLDEENVLESGVEIVAQPPEKGAKSLDMLSGGEKVMTTTALLFAIFTARPCPFCLLDEIDAALDEANIQRFLDMVNSFLEKTQFIIVTHNKRTIAEADVIHGITMPKAGRSRRVSVRFDDGELKTTEDASRVFALEKAGK